MVFDLPEDKPGWERAVKSTSLQPTDSDTSASKISLPDFLRLRVFWKYRPGKAFRDSGIIPKDQILGALRFLGTQDSWKAYRALVESTVKDRNGPTKDIGTFALVHLFQQQVRRVGERLNLQQEPEDCPKVLYTPIAYNTRSYARILETQQVTPTKNTSTAKSNLAQRLAGMNISEKGKGRAIESSSPALRSESSTSESPEYSVPPKMSSVSPWQGPAMSVACDEQTVNTALVSLLSAITMLMKDLNVEWTLHQRTFNISTNMKARTDGILRDRRSGKPLAILEVKSAPRFFRRDHIRMQEGAQMAAWISTESAFGQFSHSMKDNLMRLVALQHLVDLANVFSRMIISQDHFEIYITIAEYGWDFVRFIQTIDPKRTIPSNQDASMTMREFGPFLIHDGENMAEFAAIILAYIRRI
ncbi:MAG: hypothetical protein Q9227_004565 [Pyrenula ochraceoflavens]